MIYLWKKGLEDVLDSTFWLPIILNVDPYAAQTRYCWSIGASDHTYSLVSIIKQLSSLKMQNYKVIVAITLCRVMREPLPRAIPGIHRYFFLCTRPFPNDSFLFVSCLENVLAMWAY